MKRNKAGFTIVELLIVIVVVAILATITVVAYNGIRERATATAIASGLTSIEKALRMQAVDEGWSVWPNDDQILATGSNPTIERLIAELDGFDQYIQQAPSTTGFPASGWEYDNDNNVKLECAEIHFGTNIIVRDMPQSIGILIDDQLDGDGEIECGTVRWRAYNSSLYYSLSYTNGLN